MSGTNLDCAAEQARLAALAAFEILDTAAETDFDDLTRLAAAALAVDSAAVSLIDERRQWFKSRHGIPFAETPRDIAFCDYAIRGPDVFVVRDASADPRFADNPLVTCDGGVRFYAGAPLIDRDGHCLGTLCVFDPAPRTGLTDYQRTLLTELARMTVNLIESRLERRLGLIAAKVVEQTVDAVLAIDASGVIVYWNAAAVRMFDRSADEAIGQRVEIIIPPRLAVGHPDILARVEAGGATRLVGTAVELIAARRDGSEFPVELSLARWGDSNGEHGFAAIVRDITRRRLLEAERRSAKAFLDTVISNLPAMLFVKDAESRRYLMMNRAGEQVTGRRAAAMIGSTDRDLFPAMGEGYEDRDTALIAGHGASTHESVFIRDDGSRASLRTTRVLIDGPDRPAQYILGMSEDVTEVRVAQAEVMRLAHYDTITGLLNRASYNERLETHVAAREPFALLLIDLDRFKAINDQFGHHVGDRVLADSGDRLRATIAAGDWIARIGGDEFAIVLTGHNLRHRARSVARAVVDAIGNPFATGRTVAHTGASVGVVLYPCDGTNAPQISEHADLALYRAKAVGRGAVCLFNAEMDEAARDRRTLETDLRAAIEARAITLAYQPVASIETGTISSFEALARWHHPDRGMISPEVFIPLAEECGLIDVLGQQLLCRACHDAAQWPSHLRVAVNLSPLQFMSGALATTIDGVLRDTGLAANRLQLEITERLLIKDVDRTFAQLETLRALGIQILLDDFGVGFSSLSYFQRFRFDKVKIDRSFITSMHTSLESRAIIQAVIGLGRKLGMAVVAEGVEDDLQQAMLVAFGCTHLQGYLIGQPIAPDRIDDMLNDWSMPSQPPLRMARPRAKG